MRRPDRSAVLLAQEGLVMSQSRFYGIEGFGNSFVYVIDRSDSMNEFDGAPLRAAKRELLESLQSLQSVNQFQIIFYNNATACFDRRSPAQRGLIRGHDNEREQAAQFVRQVEALGGTEHVAALRLAMRMQPDVIFFLNGCGGTKDVNRAIEFHRRQLRTNRNHDPFGRIRKWCST